MKQRVQRTAGATYPVKSGAVPPAPNTVPFGQFKRQALSMLPPFLTPEEKKDLKDNQTPFYIKAYRFNPTNKFGESVTFTVVIEGEHRALTLSNSIYRQTQLEAMSSAGRQQGSQFMFDRLIGPVVLAQLPNPDNSKNPIWDIVDPNDPEGIANEDEPIA